MTGEGSHRLEADAKDLSFPVLDSRFRGNDEGGCDDGPREAVGRDGYALGPVLSHHGFPMTGDEGEL